MTREELIRLGILSACCDDYEALEQIYIFFNRIGRKIDPIPTEAEINVQILELVTAGLIDAYYFVPPGKWVEAPREELRDELGQPYAGRSMNEAYFYTTKKGRALQGPQDWPFDEFED